MSLQLALLSQLSFDPLNPRLPEAYKDTSDDEVINWFLSDASLIDLMASIAENGFFQGEPIIVIKEQGKFIVVEGNRRLAAVKLLNKPESAKHYNKTVNEITNEAKEKGNIPTQLPIFICPNRDYVENYLAFRHVTGVKPWPVISKARFLYNIYVKQLNGKQPTEEHFKEIAKEIGNKAAYVKRLIWGYELFETIKENGFYKIKDINTEEDFDLALITDASITNKNISEYLNINTSKSNPIKDVDKTKLKEVTIWLYEKEEKTKKPRVPESRQIKLLNEVLGSKEAKEKFITTNISLSDALELTQFSYAKYQLLIKKVESTLNNLQILSKNLKEFNSKDLDKIKSIKEQIDTVEKNIYQSLK
ncbi:MAG: ParB/RepB/Spo0J family partition protein [Bacteroidia bacterium]